MLLFIAIQAYFNLHQNLSTEKHIIVSWSLRSISEQLPSIMKRHSLFSVFVVDDDKMFRMFLEKQLLDKLKRLITIRTFQDGESCLRYLHQKPDLIILDYELGLPSSQVMNGIDILDCITTQSPETVVIMVSGKGRIDIVVEAIRHGALDFIEKNEATFDKTSNLIFNAIQSESIMGRVARDYFRPENKRNISDNIYHRIHTKTRTFFSPITLPEKFEKKIIPRKKRSYLHSRHLLT
jgi:FixJ family two-component response regulator